MVSVVDYLQSVPGQMQNARSADRTRMGFVFSPEGEWQL